MPVFKSGILETFTSFLNQIIQDPSCKNIEIEAKFGRYLDKSTKQRVHLPILTEAVLEPGRWYQFDSEISQSEHAMFNTKFNALVEGQPSEWGYAHTKTIDSILQDGARVSREASSERVVEVLRKARLGDFAIYCPNRPFDIRISINREEPIHNYAPSDNARIEHERFKDRLSYTMTRSSLRYDLTQVKQTGHGRDQVRYELELEHLHPEQVLHGPQAFLQAVLSLADR